MADTSQAHNVTYATSYKTNPQQEFPLQTKLKTFLCWNTNTFKYETFISTLEVCLFNKSLLGKLASPVTSLQAPAQLFVACSMEKWGETHIKYKWQMKFSTKRHPHFKNPITHTFQHYFSYCTKELGWGLGMRPPNNEELGWGLGMRPPNSEELGWGLGMRLPKGIVQAATLTHSIRQSAHITEVHVAYCLVFYSFCCSEPPGTLMHN